MTLSNDPKIKPANKKPRRKRKKRSGKGAGQGDHIKAQAEIAKRVVLAALDQTLFPEIRHTKKRAYVIALAETGNRTQAAKVAGIGRTTPYDPGWSQDTALQSALAQAQEAAADLLESEAYRRAVDGVNEPVGWYQGRAGGMIRRYSDVLLIFLLKGLRPEKYKDRIELRGVLANLDLSQLPDHLIERIAKGEHPLSVLASAIEGELKALPAGSSEGDSADVA